MPVTQVEEWSVPAHVNENGEVVFAEPADSMLYFSIIDGQIVHVEHVNMIKDDKFDGEYEPMEDNKQIDLFEILTSNEFHGEYEGYGQDEI